MSQAIHRKHATIAIKGDNILRCFFSYGFAPVLFLVSQVKM